MSLTPHHTVPRTRPFPTRTHPHTPTRQRAQASVARRPPLGRRARQAADGGDARAAVRRARRLGRRRRQRRDRQRQDDAGVRARVCSCVCVRGRVRVQGCGAAKGLLLLLFRNVGVPAAPPRNLQITTIASQIKHNINQHNNQNAVPCRHLTGAPVRARGGDPRRPRRSDGRRRDAAAAHRRDVGRRARRGGARRARRAGVAG